MNTKIGNRRLLKLAAFLEDLPRKRFFFGAIGANGVLPTLAHTCKTTGCAIGWAPAVLGKPARRFSDVLSAGYFTTPAMELFGVSALEADWLFLPTASPLGDHATPKQVAAHIRKFVKGRK